MSSTRVSTLGNRRLLASVGAAALLVSPLTAALPDAITLGRFHAFEQTTSAATPTAAGGFVLATVSFTEVVSGTTVTLVKPDGTSVSFTASGDDFVYDSPDYSTTDALKSAWPDGTYTFKLTGTNSGSYTVNLAGSSGSVPTAPTITNLDEAQAIENGSKFTLKFSSLGAATTTDAVITSVLNDDGSYRWMSPAPGQTGAVPAVATAYAIPSLPVDAQLTGSLAFGRTVEDFTTNNGATTVSAGVASVTYFPIKTGDGSAGAGVIEGEISLASGSGWKTASWFGNYYRVPGLWPWIYHTDHGWLYTAAGSGDSVYFWQPSTGWLWTKPSAYSYLYSYSLKSWVYYREGSTSPRWFYNAKTAGWYSVQ